MNPLKSHIGLVQGIALALLLGCNSGGGGAPAAPADVSGTWRIVESITGNCPGQQTSDQYSVTVTQNGSSITVASSSGTFQGSVNGNTLSWTGSYPEDGGIVTITGMSLTVTGNSLSGTASWTWSDGSMSCSGSTSVTGTRTSGGGGGGTGGSIAGTWLIQENVLVSSGPCQSLSTSYTIQATQTGLAVEVVAGGFTFNGSIRGSEVYWAGSYPEAGGTTTMTMTATIQGDSLSGGSSWYWTDGSDYCTGTSTFTGSRTGSALDLSFVGAWRFSEEVLRAIGIEPPVVGDMQQRDLEFVRSPAGEAVVRGLGVGDVPARFDLSAGQLMFHVARPLPNGDTIDEEFSMVFDGAGEVPTAFGLCEWTISRDGQLVAQGTSGIDGERIASAADTSGVIR